MKKEAPIFVDAYRVALALERGLGQEAGPLAAALRSAALTLLQHITLALKGFDTAERLFEADEALIRVRLLLRLRIDVEQAERGLLLEASEHLVRVGKQLGGWRRSLSAQR